jgi:nitrate/TMAO reductase-like tetraheme cytochrome c subunit
MTIFLVLVGVLELALMVVLARQWKLMNRIGRVSLAGLVFAFFPAVWGGAIMLHGMNEMKEVTFCGSCHIMEPYLASLESDDTDSIPAIHFQNNWVAQKTACFDCHSEYGMWGNIKAKANGLRHVLVNYTNPPKGDIELYKPYKNSDCLHCHGASKKFNQSENHVDDLEDILAGELGCLECHDVGHVLPN